MTHDPVLQYLLSACDRLRDRIRSARGERDGGALSIELALLVAALVVIAGILVTILVSKVTQKGNAIN
jgi:hypothetical protein